MNNDDNYNYNNSNVNNTPQPPNQYQIQRQSIQRDMDKQEQHDANNRDMSNIIGQHNYSYDAQTPNQRGIVAKLRRKIRPLMQWWKHVHYRLEESARKRKRIIVLSFVVIMIFSFVYGHYDKLGIAVANTSVGTTRAFVNNDAIKMTSEKYDTKNQSLQANFVTNSPSGNVSPKNLSANFVFAQLPKKDGLKRPTLNLIPTFNNHFTVIIHHVYPNFGGVEISFHNNSTMTVDTLASISRESMNGSSFLTGEQNKEVQNIAQDGASAGQSSKIQKLLTELENKNISNFVIGERYILKHNQGSIDPTISPRDLALHDLDRHLNADRSKVEGTTTLISREKRQIKSYQNKIRQINRGADTGDKTSELKATAGEVQSLDEGVGNYQKQIAKLKLDIRLTLSRIHRVKENISVMPKTKSPRPIGSFSNSAH